MGIRMLFCSTDFLEGGAGHFCVIRHVRRLKAAGWLTELLTTERPQERRTEFFDDDEFEQISLIPRTRWFWPRLTRRIPWTFPLHRFFFTCEALWRALVTRPDMVMHILDVTPGAFSAVIASALRVPLGVIVYDLREIWADTEQDREMLFRDSAKLFTRAQCIWFVSPELLEEYLRKIPTLDRAKCKVLPPIPGSIPVTINGWKPEYEHMTTVLFAGSLKSQQTDVFTALAEGMHKSKGRLVIMTQERRWPSLKQSLQGFESVVEIEAIKPTPEEGLPWIAKTASTLLVHYSFVPGAEELGKTSFPSKFLEYTHLGLPIIIAATRDTAVGRWAVARKWPLYIDDLESDVLPKMLEQLKIREFWEECAARSLETARGEFCPEAIQHQFEVDLDEMMVQKA